MWIVIWIATKVLTDCFWAASNPERNSLRSVHNILQTDKWTVSE